MKSDLPKMLQWGAPAEAANVPPLLGGGNPVLATYRRAGSVGLAVRFLSSNFEHGQTGDRSTVKGEGSMQSAARFPRDTKVKRPNLPNGG